VFVNDVIHEAVLKVFEGGTIAAASTAVIFGTKDGGPSEQTITFDRPFTFAILDQPTGEILFLGHVFDPTST
jgi:serpin B